MTKKQTVMFGDFLYNDAGIELDDADTESVQAWLVFGVGQPQIRMLVEGERVKEAAAHDDMANLPNEWFTAWDVFKPESRWIISVTATERDLLDVLSADKKARVIGYVAQKAVIADDADVEFEAPTEAIAEPVTMVEAAE